MAVTDNLLLPLLTEGQSQKEITVNTSLEYLDDLVAGYLSLSVAGSADVTLTEAQARHRRIRFTGVLTGAINVIVPTRARDYLVLNSTTGAYSLTVKTTAGTGVAIAQTFGALLTCDGTNIVDALTGSSLTGPTAGPVILVNSSAPAVATDSVKLSAVDTGGVAGKSGLLLTTEDGTAHVLGDVVGIGLTTGIDSKLHIRGADGVHGTVTMDSYVTGITPVTLQMRHARGTSGTPALLNASDRIGQVSAIAYGRNAGDTADVFLTLVALRMVVDSKDAQGRMGGRLEIWISGPVSGGITEIARFTEAGNFLLGATSFGTSAAKVLAIGNGTAPATSPADMTQVWSADQEGTAGQAALHILDETGVTTSIGKGLLTRRVVEASTAGSGAPNVLLASESHKILTNEGSTARNYHTLPSAVAGLVFTYVVQDADGMRVTAAAGDTIRVAAGVTAAAGFIENGAIGDVITLAAINATEWIDIGSRGTWTPT